MFSHFLFPLLVLSPLLEARAITPQQRQPPVAGNRDAEIIAWYSGIGKCFGYFGPGNHELAETPCKAWCAKQFPESKSGSYIVGCKGPDSSIEEYPDASIISTDEAGLPWVPGSCFCTPPFKFEFTGGGAEALGGSANDGFSRLDDAINHATQSALQLVVGWLRCLALASVVITFLVAARILRSRNTRVKPKLERY